MRDLELAGGEAVVAGVAVAAGDAGPETAELAGRLVAQAERSAPAGVGGDLLEQLLGTLGVAGCGVRTGGGDSPLGVELDRRFGRLSVKSPR